MFLKNISRLYGPTRTVVWVQLNRFFQVKYLFSLQTANDFMVICNVAKILELVVPLMEHPSETFLATIEEDLMKLIIKYGMTVCERG